MDSTNVTQEATKRRSFGALRRIDGSKQKSDLEFGFAIYLRALGASSMLDLAKF